jgi:hypothetical protein
MPPIKPDIGAEIADLAGLPVVGRLAWMGARFAIELGGDPETIQLRRSDAFLLVMSLA